MFECWNSHRTKITVYDQLLNNAPSFSFESFPACLSRAWRNEVPLPLNLNNRLVFSIR